MEIAQKSLEIWKQIIMEQNTNFTNSQFDKLFGVPNFLLKYFTFHIIYQMPVFSIETDFFYNIRDGCLRYCTLVFEINKLLGSGRTEIFTTFSVLSFNIFFVNIILYSKLKLLFFFVIKSKINYSTNNNWLI